MLITEDWLFIHFPRTGGSWIREALRSACVAQETSHLYLPIHTERWRAVAFFRRDVPILGSMRHPCDWYVSKYEYLLSPAESFSKERFSKYIKKAVNGENFTDMLVAEGARSFSGLTWTPDQGAMTAYVYYWFSMAPWQPGHSPLNCPHSWGKTPTTVEKLKESVNNVTFTVYDTLTEDLDRWLSQHGFEAPARMAAKNFPRFNRTLRRECRPWQEYFTQEDFLLVRNKERLLFEIWPQFQKETL